VLIPSKSANEIFCIKVPKYIGKTKAFQKFKVNALIKRWMDQITYLNVTLMLRLMMRIKNSQSHKILLKIKT